MTFYRTKDLHDLCKNSFNKYEVFCPHETLKYDNRHNTLPYVIRNIHCTEK
jgi:hypothetical protein